MPDLSEFLEAAPVDTDLRVQEWHSQGSSSLQVRIEAESPWWKLPVDRASLVGELLIRFEGVELSSIDPAYTALDPEQLSVSHTDPRLWRFGPRGALFGNGPVSDPSQLLTELADWLFAQSDPQDLRFYCGGVSFAVLTERLSSQSYAFMDGPLPVLEEAARRFEVRGVPHRLLRHNYSAPAQRHMAVWLGPSWVVCTKAHVQLSEHAG